MSKIKLGNPPKTFKAMVAIPMLDGSTADVEITFKYRTKAQFGALLDEVMAQVEKPAKSKDKTIEASLNSSMQNNAEYVLKIAEGWDLDDPFNAETIAQLDNEYNGAIEAIGQKYREALLEGRAKN